MNLTGPHGEQSWNREDFITIDPKKLFIIENYFCDEAGNKNPAMHCMHWKNRFYKTQEGTKVEVEITFAETADLEKIIKMGFEAGFTAGLENLDELLEK
ncbi:MAG TPA: SRPBCC domain-containing protein [Ginsengibacter sp.]